MFSGLLNMTMPNAQRMPRRGQKRKALSNKVSHLDWPACTGLIKLKGPKNRTAVSSKAGLPREVTGLRGAGGPAIAAKQQPKKNAMIWAFIPVLPRLSVLYEDEMTAGVAPDPQQDVFIFGGLRELRRLRGAADFLLIDGLNNIPGPETCLRCWRIRVEIENERPMHIARDF